MNDLLILGAGGHAKVVTETALASGLFSNVALLDDRFSEQCDVASMLGWPVIGKLDFCLSIQCQNMFSAAFVAIGHAPTRLHWIQHLFEAGYNIPTLVHPTAWVSPSAHLGHGSGVFAQAAVQADVHIANGVIMNTGSSVDHDSQLADGVHICPGARLAGEVCVGHRSWIGIGSSVIQQVHIGCDVTVGAGAVVLHDLSDGVTAIGVPACPVCVY